MTGVKDREANRISAGVIEGTDAWTLQSFVEDHVSSDARVFTDEHGGYIGALAADHATVNSSGGECVREKDGVKVHTNGNGSFWSMLKRAHADSFHKISPKHLDRYVQEFVGRHNVRELDTVELMRDLLAGIRGGRLTCAALIYDNGKSSGAKPTAPTD